MWFLVSFVGKNVDQSDMSKFDDTSSNVHKYYVVNSDELLRLKNLLVFY